VSTIASAPGEKIEARPARPLSVAMVGAGQLARMTHQAATSLGVRLRVLADSVEDPAVKSGADHVIGSYESIDDLRRVASGCDVITFDHEHVPPDHLAALEAEGYRLAPGRDAKLMAQDKLHARRTLSDLGYPVPEFAHAVTREDISRFAESVGLPIVAKAPRGGYDGKGVWTLVEIDDGEDLLSQIPEGLLLEPCLAIVSELSVLVARSANGERVAYPVAETIQQDAMCREILAPAPIADELAAQATRIAIDIAEDIGAVGVLAVELFSTTDGLLVNELALRPHNSGHYTIEGCTTSQFEQHLRAVLGLPLGLPSMLAPAVATHNVIGNADSDETVMGLEKALAVPGAHVHLYEKSARKGRKLGHVTVCGQDIEPVRQAARIAANALEGKAA